MPFDEAVVKTKIGDLDQKLTALSLLQAEVGQIHNSLEKLLEIEQVDRNPDGSPKTNQDGSFVLIKVMPTDNGTMEELTTARRTMIYDKMIAAADAAIAKTA